MVDITAPPTDEVPVVVAEAPLESKKEFVTRDEFQREIERVIKLQTKEKQEQDKRFAELNGRLENIDKRFLSFEQKIDKVLEGSTNMQQMIALEIAKAQMSISAMEDKQSVRNEQVAQLNADVKAVQTDNAVIASRQVAQLEEVKQIQAVVFGDKDKPDMPSLFKMVEKLGDKIEGYHTKTEESLLALKDTSKATGDTVKALQEAEAKRKAMWRTIFDTGKKVVEQAGWKVVTAGLLGSGIGTLLWGLLHH